MLQLSILKRQSRNSLGVKLGLEKRLSLQKADYSLPRRKSCRKSINKLQPCLHSRSIHNNASTPSVKKPKGQVSQLFVKAKSLYKEYKLQQATFEFQRVLNLQPDHQEGLYLIAICQLNLDRLSQAAKYLQRLIILNPHYKSNVYLLSAICYNKLKQSQKALESLGSAILKYPQFYEAYCYRAKIHMAAKKYQKAESDFDKALEIDDKRLIAITGKADCLRNRGLYKQAIKYYSKAIELGGAENILLKRAIIYFENKFYQQSLKDLNKLLEKNPFSQVYYYRGKLYLEYQHDESRAILMFQQAIKQRGNNKIITKSVEQLLKIRINACDFYECSSILTCAKYQQIKNLIVWEKLIEAVICLMKKKHDESETLFKELEKVLTLGDENYTFIHPISNLYRAYAYFCLHRYESAYHQIVQYQRYMLTVLGQDVIDPRICYNKQLFESLMLCESDCFEESIEKLDGLIQSDPLKTQPLFYKFMIMLIVAFSEAPYIFDFETKDQILVASLELLQDALQLSQSSNLLFFDGLLKTYFGLLPEAQKSVTKAIEKGQDHLGRLFCLRTIIHAMNGNHESAINDISIALNIEQKAQYLLYRCRLHQKLNHTEDAYQDLQKYIQLEQKQDEVSRWAALILFQNGAFEECERAITKVPIDHQHPDLSQLWCYINFMNGKFEQAGSEGALIINTFEGKDVVGFDNLINGKQCYSYFSKDYLHYLRAIRYYIIGEYGLAIKDFQYLLFASKQETDLILQIKYNLMVCHLLNGDQISRNKYLQLSQKIDQILSTPSNVEVEFGDLEDILGKKRLSRYLPSKQIPGTLGKIKLSIPFPIFPQIVIDLKITDDFIKKFIKLEWVEGKAEAPWIRRMQKNQAVQFTNSVQDIQISLKSSIHSSANNP